jgi:hypothetical protein
MTLRKQHDVKTEYGQLADCMGSSLYAGFFTYGGLQWIESRILTATSDKMRVNSLTIEQ